ncbi:MAG: His/Gly/Thr/Pro-type tRNA ligase C-terminal domain-containing protein [Patescibacteria group bacterium]|nr:His/Gly/Thr/Pro-type tRNA ligase C-terminal domain-containing protein [Patescibacteria group bacterium]
MKQSQLFFKTRKEVPADADSINASYLIRAGFAEKHMAGVYALLPLGYKVAKKIENIVREEMNAIGGQEILMNVLQPKELWEETDRWESAVDIFYKLKDSRGKELCLAPTHEEQVIDIARRKINSYKDLPFGLYQIQTKFRNEPRAKSGLLRGREFIMKDLYSFHADEEDLNRYYEEAKKAYFKVFKRLGLDTKLVEASGGIFSKFSHEFQVLSPVGEDTIYYCDSPAGECDFAQNKEVATVKEGDICPKCDGRIKIDRGIEVGNIFPLKNKYTAPMKATFLDKDGKEKDFIMGCYGIGITRSLATIVEVYYDSTKNKMIWPEEVSPYKVHLLSLNKNVIIENSGRSVGEEVSKLYEKLIQDGVEVLYDDRDISAGEKFAEADLIGCPKRIIVSEKSLKSGGVEVTEIKTGKSEIEKLDSINI